MQKDLFHVLSKGWRDPESQQETRIVLASFNGVDGAIEKFIAWYCSEPRLTFNRSVVVKYRSFLERLSLSAATINLHLSAIRRLADESAESGWLRPEHAIGIRRVKVSFSFSMTGGFEIGRYVGRTAFRPISTKAPRSSVGRST